MRRLTKKQKALIDSYMKANEDVKGVDDLDPIFYSHLEKVNNTEILYQEIERYIWDKIWDN